MEGKQNGNTKKFSQDEGDTRDEKQIQLFGFIRILFRNGRCAVLRPA